MKKTILFALALTSLQSASSMYLREDILLFDNVLRNLKNEMIGQSTCIAASRYLSAITKLLSGENLIVSTPTQNTQLSREKIFSLLANKDVRNILDIKGYCDYEKLDFANYFKELLVKDSDPSGNKEITVKFKQDDSTPENQKKLSDNIKRFQEQVLGRCFPYWQPEKPNNGAFKNLSPLFPPKLVDRYDGHYSLRDLKYDFKLLLSDIRLAENFLSQLSGNSTAKERAWCIWSLIKKCNGSPMLRNNPLFIGFLWGYGSARELNSDLIEKGYKKIITGESDGNIYHYPFMPIHQEGQTLFYKQTSKTFAVQGGYSLYKVGKKIAEELFKLVKEELSRKDTLLVKGSDQWETFLYQIKGTSLGGLFPSDLKEEFKNNEQEGFKPGYELTTYSDLHVKILEGHVTFLQKLFSQSKPGQVSGIFWENLRIFMRELYEGMARHSDYAMVFKETPGGQCVVVAEPKEPLNLDLFHYLKFCHRIAYVHPELSFLIRGEKSSKKDFSSPENKEKVTQITKIFEGFLGQALFIKKEELYPDLPNKMHLRLITQPEYTSTVQALCNQLPDSYNIEVVEIEPEIRTEEDSCTKMDLHPGNEPANKPIPKEAFLLYAERAQKSEVRKIANEIEEIMEVQKLFQVKERAVEAGPELLKKCGTIVEPGPETPGRVTNLKNVISVFFVTDPLYKEYAEKSSRKEYTRVIYQPHQKKEKATDPLKIQEISNHQFLSSSKGLLPNPVEGENPEISVEKLGTCGTAKNIPIESSSEPEKRKALLSLITKGFAEMTITNRDPGGEIFLGKEADDPFANITKDFHHVTIDERKNEIPFTQDPTAEKSKVIISKDVNEL